MAKSEQIPIGVCHAELDAIIQIVLLRNCQTPTATTHAISTWLEWVKRSTEDQLVAKRAVACKHIIAAIADQN